jgi:hypothetical protein
MAKADLVKYILKIVELLLGLRFVFKSLAASAEAPIIVGLNFITDSLVWPFKNIFQSLELKNGGIFDLPALTAMIVYALMVFIPILIHRANKDNQKAE